MNVRQVGMNSAPGGLSEIRLVVDGDKKSIASLVAKVMDKPTDYEFSIKKIRAKRSLDANGLLWACLREIGAALGCDKWDVYLMMLKRYGKHTYVVLHERAVEDFIKGFRTCEVVGEVNVNGAKGIQLLCYYGSSTYNTKEFSVLLDGVISEMKDMGLNTPTTEQEKEALKEWERYGKQ